MRGGGKYGSSRTTENNHRSSFCSSSMTPKTTTNKQRKKKKKKNPELQLKMVSNRSEIHFCLQSRKMGAYEKWSEGLMSICACLTHPNKGYSQWVDNGVGEKMSRHGCRWPQSFRPARPNQHQCHLPACGVCSRDGWRTPEAGVEENNHRVS